MNAEAAGELQHVMGADREEEIVGIVDFDQRRTGNLAAQFDDMPGYAKDRPVLPTIRAEFGSILPRGH